MYKTANETPRRKGPSLSPTESLKNSGLNATRTHDLCDELAVSLIAQLIEHCTGIAEDMGVINGYRIL